MEVMTDLHSDFDSDTQTLTEWRKANCAPRDKTMTSVLLVFMTGNFWCAIRAVKYYKRNPYG